MSESQSHKDMVAWQKAIALATTVYAATRLLPSDEHFGLCEQMRRAAVSIPSTIAEGAARKSRAELLEFLRRSRRSLAELETQVMIALQQQVLTESNSGLREIAELDEILSQLTSKLAYARREAHAKACAPHTRQRKCRSELAANP